MHGPKDKERRSGEERRKCHLNLKGTYFIERRRQGFDRRGADPNEVDQMPSSLSISKKLQDCLMDLK